MTARHASILWVKPLAAMPRFAASLVGRILILAPIARRFCELADKGGKLGVMIGESIEDRRIGNNGRMDVQGPDANT